MSKAALVQILDRWTGSHECDPDSSFLTRFLTKRDEDAFAALVRRHGPLVYGTCLRILGNRTDTDDAFQAVFFVLARRAHTLKLDRSIGPWLHGVAVRVAKKLRGQIVRRRLREMSAAKSERVEAAEPEHDFWAIIDEELARMSLPLREVLLLCDLSGQSHAQTAASLGLAKGTITKRLAKAREELATRLRRRGITLGVGALSTMIATQAPASVPAPLLLETAKQAVAFSIGQVGGSVTAKTLAEGVMRVTQIRCVQGVARCWPARTDADRRRADARGRTGRSRREEGRATTGKGGREARCGEGRDDVEGELHGRVSRAACPCPWRSPRTARRCSPATRAAKSWP